IAFKIILGFALLISTVLANRGFGSHGGFGRGFGGFGGHHGSFGGGFGGRGFGHATSFSHGGLGHFGGGHGYGSYGYGHGKK
ncbi:hypothetical protein SK128_020981, partial [Halocaridina rubra]